jgi:putative FmdB family regulatory protein
VPTWNVEESVVPTYAYACTACGHRFDAVQSFTEPSLTECPECAGRLRKLFSSVGVVFKGSGFYRTDSRAAASSAEKPSDKSASKETVGAGASGSSVSNGAKPNPSSSTTGTTTPAKAAS